LAECGLAGAKLVTFEAEVGTALLSVSADVARSSAAASALERLTPWLALVLGGAPPPLPAPTRSDNREGERLSELALRFGLTSRQAQVAWLMIQGESNKGIAVTLGCAEGIVEVHVQAVLAKSGVPGRAALASRFYERF
jgi:DNA-binding NarL/FixJ family response regulator